MSRLHMWRLIAGAARAWGERSAATLSAAMAFYAMISLAPLVALSVGIAGSLAGSDAVRLEVTRTVESLLDPLAAEVVVELLDQGWFSDASPVGNLLALGILVYGATVGFAHLRSSVNQVFGTPTAELVAWRLLVRDRLAAFVLVLAVGVSLVGLLSLQAIADAFDLLLGRVPGAEGLLAMVGPTVLSVLALTGLFGLLLRVLPERDVPWRAAGIGGAATAFLYLVGQLLIGLYMSRVSLASAFGAAGSLVALMLWIYYSCMIFLFGAALTSRLIEASPDGRGQPGQPGLTAGRARRDPGPPA